MKSSSSMFMPYVCCGDPDVRFTIRLVRTLVENGAGAIELGIPFSDPIADGKTIQAASVRSLNGGMTPDKAFEALARIRKDGIGVPVYIMTYYNLVFANGIDNFLQKAKKAGANGLIVPDVPLEESDELHEGCRAAGIDLVYFITPNCPDERLKRIAARASGFLYAVSTFGTTGARKDVSDDAIKLIKRAKRITGLPVVIGFGVSDAAQAAEYAKAGADGVIVGSRIVDIYSGYPGEEDKALAEIASFSKDVSGRLKGNHPIV